MFNRKQMHPVFLNSRFGQEEERWKEQKTTELQAHEEDLSVARNQI